MESEDEAGFFIQDREPSDFEEAQDDAEDSYLCTKTKRSGRRKSFADDIRPIASTISILACRMLKRREVFEGFSRPTAEQVYQDLHKLNHLIQSLRQKLGAEVNIPKADQHVEASQISTLLKLAMVSLYQNSSGLAAEAERGPECDLEASAMAADCHALVRSLSARFEGDASLTPAAALRTLADAKRRFGLAVLERVGMGGRRVAPADELAQHLRRLFAELDTDASGTIDLSELGAAMAALEVPATNAELRRFMAAADADADGAVSFAEFHALVVAILRDNGVAVVSTPAASPAASPEPGPARRLLDPPRISQRRRSSNLGPIRELNPVLPAPLADASAEAPPTWAAYLFPKRRRSILKAAAEPAAADRRRSSITNLIGAALARRRSSIEAEAGRPAAAAPQYSHLRPGGLGMRGWRSAPDLQAL